MENLLFKLALFLVFQAQIVLGAPVLEEPIVYGDLSSFSVTTTQTFIDISNETNVIRCNSNYENTSLEWKYIPSEWNVTEIQHEDYIELHVIDAKNITSENNIQCVGYYFYNVTNFAYKLAEVEIVSEIHYAQFESSKQNQVDVPYESRVKVYCNDITSDVVTITIDVSNNNQFIVANSLISKYKDHYEFEIVNGTIGVFTVKYLTFDLNISCNNSRSNKKISIKGYNTVDINKTKYTTDTTDVAESYIYHPIGSEVNLYCDYEMNIAVIYQDGTVDVIVDKLEFKDYFSSDFNFEKTILDSYVFTIKNITKGLNGTKVILFNDKGDIYKSIHVIGFEYELIADPSCVSQTTESNAMYEPLNEPMSHYFCVVEKSNPLSSVSYLHQSGQSTTDMTSKMITFDFNEDAILFQLSLLNDNDNDVVSCSVTQLLPGKYVNVKTSVCLPYN